MFCFSPLCVLLLVTGLQLTLSCDNPRLGDHGGSASSAVDKRQKETEEHHNNDDEDVMRVIEKMFSGQLDSSEEDCLTNDDACGGEPVAVGGHWLKENNVDAHRRETPEPDSTPDAETWQSWFPVWSGSAEGHSGGGGSGGKSASGGTGSTGGGGGGGGHGALGTGRRIPGNFAEEAEAMGFLKDVDRALSNLTRVYRSAKWTYASNLTHHNRAAVVDAKLNILKIKELVLMYANRYDWKLFRSEDVSRQLKLLSNIGVAVLPEQQLRELVRLKSDIETKYSDAKICDYNKTNCYLGLESGIVDRMAVSYTPSELKHFWVKWRKETGKRMRDLYRRYIELSSKAYKTSGVVNTKEFSMLTYEYPGLRDDMARLWNGLKPLYENLHAYVRHKLFSEYGKYVMSEKGPIPAHLLRSLWSHNWCNVKNLVLPYPSRSVDVSQAMLNQSYTPLKMIKTAEEYFTSMGLPPMPDSFWSSSVIGPLKSGDHFICEPRAWDFGGGDVRIKFCGQVNMQELASVHHEMGHMQYFLHYKDQPYAFRKSANPGFQDAVADALSLSITLPSHLQKIGLLRDYSSDNNNSNSDINYLMTKALEKIPLLPYAYVVDQWKWDIFDNRVKHGDYNCHYWKLKYEIEGVRPPVIRGEDDFDPPFKFYDVIGVKYERFFVSTILQFQLFRALCVRAGQYNASNPATEPLHRCDLHRSKEAGRMLATMMQLGLSKNWQSVLKTMTGQDEMDPGALRDYFRPLEEWLTVENKRTGVNVGWTRVTKSTYCSHSWMQRGKEVQIEV